MRTLVAGIVLRERLCGAFCKSCTGRMVVAASRNRSSSSSAELDRDEADSRKKTPSLPNLEQKKSENLASSLRDIRAMISNTFATVTGKHVRRIYRVVVLPC